MSSSTEPPNPNPNSSDPTMASPTLLQFAALQSMVDEGFWRRLSSLKLDTLGIDESPVQITGFLAPCSHARVSKHLTLLAESLPSDSSEKPLSLETSGVDRNKCPIPGVLYNMNTMENFRSVDKGQLLRMEVEKIWEDIWSGRVEEESNLLLRFFVISFADLKKWKFHYLFAFPALMLDPPASLVDIRPASKYFSSEEAVSLTEALNEWRSSSLTTDVPFFLVSVAPNSNALVKPLKDWENIKSNDHKLLFGFYDPCHQPNNPGWPLRNFLAFISLRWKLEKVTFLCYRERHGLADLGLSLVGDALISLPKEWADPQCVPKAVGWELNKGKLATRCISLAESMDPTRLAVSAADLNLKLMRWRTLPSLNLEKLSSVKCLLLGAGTLGCQVARMLMAWGIRKITLVDNGRVAMSNPLRQSLYTFDDCSNGGDLKVIAAARCLKRIFPAAEAEGVSLTIPMPGHPIAEKETSSVLEDCKNLQNLVASHDVIFLLTDTRESRWLPTLLCADSNKIAINAALGFDSYLVMRHGAGPIFHGSDVMSGGNAEDVDGLLTQMEKLSIADPEIPRLGCYFCNDVVAPINSTSNRTLDQQCTVTRPGLAPIASSLAVELLVGILHHPDGLNAPGEIANSVSDGVDQPLGILPHQIRGSMSQFNQLTLVGQSSSSCTACCHTVVSEYRKRGLDFVLQVINHPTYLEDLTGLTELMKSANTFDVDWDNEDDDDM